MASTEAEQLARRAAARAHLAKNALHEDAGLTKLADAVENLALAVAELAKPDPPATSSDPI